MRGSPGLRRGSNAAIRAVVGGRHDPPKIEAADLFGDLTGIGEELAMRDNAAVAKAIDAAAWVDSAATNAVDELSVLIANVDYVINPA